MATTNCTILLSHSKLMHKSLYAYFPPYPNPSRRLKSSAIAAVTIAREPGVSAGDGREKRNLL